LKCIMEPTEFKGLHLIIRLLPENDEDKKHLDEWGDQYEDANGYIDIDYKNEKTGFLIGAGGISFDDKNKIYKDNA